MANLSLFDLNNLVTSSITNLQNQINGKQATINFDANTRWFTDIERNKLLGIQSGAEANQNAYSYIRVGATTMASASKTETLEIVAGSNMQITPNAASNQLIISNSYAYIHPDTHNASMIVEDSTPGAKTLYYH
jgi:hypothetical protein